MIYWSLKTLFSQPMRLAASSFAVATSFVLVIFFSAVFEGESDQMVAYFKAMDADVWVMQKGVANMHMASSMVWDWKADVIRNIPGVKAVKPILYLNGPVTIGGKEWFSYIMGIKPEYAAAGPWSMAAGRATPTAGEVVIPEVISQLTGVNIGEEIALINRPLKVVGLSKGTFSMASSVVFVSHHDLGDLLEGRDQYSYIMVYAEPAITPRALADKINNEVEKVNALTSTEFIRSDWQLAVQMGAEIIYMMTLVGTLLATLITAFSAYSLTAAKRRELAIAKALGFKARQIYLAAWCQSAVITAAGLLLAMAISFTLLTWLPALLPQVNLTVKLHHFVPLFILALPVATLASLGAARAVARVDPMTVFHS